VRRRHIITIRLDDVEKEALESLRKDMGVSMSELWRRLLVTVKVLYADNLPLTKALREDTDELKKIHRILRKSNMTLSDALKPIPKLIAVVSERERFSY